MPEFPRLTPTNFIATVYGELVPLNNSALSKARLKIFYKGLNRNGSFITDEVAAQMLSTLPGTPIVGTYDKDKIDFLGHVDKEKSCSYGFVPENMNFKWEMSLDPDGIYRTYACTDVVLWTGRYPIASKIVGKNHSMELNPDTVKGKWVETENDFYFQFDEAEFIGLCVLGEEVEPCFEGSSFYALRNQDTKLKTELQELFNLYKEVNNEQENSTGGKKMDEEEKKKITSETPEEEKTSTDNQVEQTVSEEENTEVVAEEATEEPVVNSEKVEEDNEEVEEDKEEDEEEEEEEEDEEETEEDEDEEKEEEEATEENDYNLIIAQKDAEIASLTAQLNELQSFKSMKNREEKEQIIEQYASKLTQEEIDSFKEKIDSYDNALEFKKDIALCILDKEKIDANENTHYTLAFTNTNCSGVEALIAKHVRK